MTARTSTQVARNGPKQRSKRVAARHNALPIEVEGSPQGGGNCEGQHTPSTPDIGGPTDESVTVFPLKNTAGNGTSASPPVATNAYTEGAAAEIASVSPVPEPIRLKDGRNAGEVDPYAPVAVVKKPKRGAVTVYEVPGYTANSLDTWDRHARADVSQNFLTDLREDWRKHGPAVLARVRHDDPSTYLRVIASVIPKEMKLGPSQSLVDLLMQAKRRERE